MPVTGSRSGWGTPGEVMQLPPDDELVMIAGAPPIRAKKLRYYEDANFQKRMLPPPCLANDGYADRPVARPDDWQGRICETDARLGSRDDKADEPQPGGGLEQARQPELELTPKRLPAPSTPDPLGLGEDDHDAAADKQTMDQARVNDIARTAYGVDSASKRPDDLQLGL
jgi:type IV secretion system protein VirD4